MSDPEGFSLADIFAKPPAAAKKEKPTLQCPKCGLSTSDFRRTGRLGCSNCYEVFKSLLLPMLDDMHEGILHKGKVPTVTLNRQSNKLQLKKLQNFLDKAIAEEAYEEAAKYRDQIKELQSLENLEVS